MTALSPTDWLDATPAPGARFYAQALAVQFAHEAAGYRMTHFRVHAPAEMTFRRGDTTIHVSIPG